MAPVREMCAQTLGVVMKHMAKLQVQAVLNVLLTLQAQEQWQVRYGGLLGAKYLLAVRQVYIYIKKEVSVWFVSCLLFMVRI